MLVAALAALCLVLALSARALKEHDPMRASTLALAPDQSYVEASMLAPTSHAMLLQARLASVDPDSPSLHMQSALLLQKAADTEDEGSLRYLRELAPGWADLCRQQPQLTDRQAFRLLSRAEFDRAFALRPFDAIGRLAAAQAALRGGDPERAWRLLDEALRIEPRFAGAWQLVAQLELAGKRRPQAGEALSQMLLIQKLHPEDGDVYDHVMQEANWDWVRSEAAKYGLK